MIKSIANLIMLLLPLAGFAQQDYVVTLSGDTLVGRISHSLITRNIKISTSEGKKKFSFRDYQSYSRKGQKFMHIRYITEKGNELFAFGRALSDGRLTLLRGLEEDPDHFLQYQGKFYILTRRYFPNDLWKQLIQCAAFAEKYGSYHQESGGKLMVFPRDHKQWMEMTGYYNAQCPATAPE